VTQPIAAALLERISWRLAFPLFGSAGVAWAVAWVLWFRDDPADHPSVNRAEIERIGAEPPAPHRGVPWAALVRSRGMLALCAMYFGAIYGWYFYLTWLPTYLLRARGFDLGGVGWLAALPLLAIAAGSLAGGAASDWLARRLGPRAGLRAPALVGLPLAAAAIAAAAATPDGRTAAWCLAAAAGLAALGVAPAWAVCLAIGGRHAGVVSGAMNTFGNLGGVASPLVVGWFLGARGSFEAPLYTVAALYLVAAACWLAVDPLAPIGARAEP
jgi:nitrate/nitrite transporter NarK